MAYSLSLRGTRKTRIPTVTAGAETCSVDCDFCYAKRPPLKWYWDKVTSGERVTDWPTLWKAIKCLPSGQRGRYALAGDIPHNCHVQIDESMLRLLVSANRNKHGFTYTHHPRTPHNIRLVEWAGARGFTINWSADSYTEADEIAASSTAPIATLPATGCDKVEFTPAGHKVVSCPADWHGLGGIVGCDTCSICYQHGRLFMVGFPKRGRGARVTR